MRKEYRSFHLCTVRCRHGLGQCFTSCSCTKNNASWKLDWATGNVSLKLGCFLFVKNTRTLSFNVYFVPVALRPSKTRSFSTVTIYWQWEKNYFHQLYIFLNININIHPAFNMMNIVKMKVLSLRTETVF